LAYSIRYKKSVAGDLARLSKSEGRRILARIEKDLAAKFCRLCFSMTPRARNLAPDGGWA